MHDEAEASGASDAAAALAAIPLFAGLTAVELARLVPELEEHDYRSGEAVFRQGEAGDGLYLLRSGVASVSIEAEGASQVVAALEAPAYVGEMALLSDEPRSASVVAVTPLTLWKLPRARFDALLEEHPRLPLQLAAEVTRRLAETSRRLSTSQHELEALARSQLDDLELDLVSLLCHAAVVSRFDAALLRELAGDELEADQLAQLQHQGLFIEADQREGWWTFSHPWVRDLLLDRLGEQLGDPALADLRRRAADVLLRRDGDDLLEVCGLLQGANAWESLAALLGERGEELCRTWPEEAERFFRALPDELVWRRPTMVRLLASCCAAQGRLEQAVETYRRAEQLDPAARVGPVGAGYQQALADLYERMGRHPQALACLRRAMELGGRGGGFSGHLGATNIPTELPSGAAAEGLGQLGALTLAGARALAITAAASGTGRSLAARWGLAIAVLALVAVAWVAPPPADLSQAGARVLSLVIASLAFTFLAVVPDFLFGLLMVTAWVLSGTLPANVAASGFASSTWFLLLSSTAIGAAVARSGLLYRGAVEIVRRLPPSHIVRCLTLATLGVVFSPGMPNVLGRISLAVPLAQDIAESLRYPPRSGGSAGLTLATYLGFGLLGTLFLTGTALSLIVYGLFPPDVQARMTWGSWFLAALPAHLLIFATTTTFILLRYRPEGRDEVRAETIALQRQVLGRLSRDEWSVLIVTGALVIGFCSQSFHRLDPAWLAVAAVAALFVFGALDDATFRGGVNVSFLLYLGVILGLGEIFSYLELDGWLGQNLQGLATFSGGNSTVFVAAVALISAGLAIALRPGPISILLGLALYPTATSIGVNPWVVAMTILLSSNLWLYPQQNLGYLTAYYGAGERGFSHAQARPVAFVHAGSNFVAILASIPYWRWLGLMP